MKAKLLQKQAADSLLTTRNLKTEKPYQPSLVNQENSKTQKGEAKGYLTGIMHLMPSDLSGHGNVCTSALPEHRRAVG